MLALLAALAASLPSQFDTPNPADAATRDNPANRPNILFAFADDWGRYASAYAAVDPGGLSDVIATPHFDRVAASGVLLPNAFVSAPSCTPCRSSLLSGRHFWQTGRGSILLGAVWDGSIPSYPLLMEKSGYHIGHTYKTWAPGKPETHPYGGRRTQYQPAGAKFNRFSQFVSEAADDDGIADRKATLLAEARANFVACLDDAERAGKPFCYWFGPTNVHRTWTPGSGKRLWGIDPDDLKGKVPPFLPDSPTVRQDLADYLGEATAFDAGLGELLAELDDRGLTENTLVVVSGDHGAPGFPNGKCNLYDFGTNVPLAACWPAKIPAGRVVTDFVSLPQLAPTFLEAGGVDRPDGMSAASLLPTLTSTADGRVDPQANVVFHGRERHVDSAQFDFAPYPMRAIRTDDWLLIRNFRPDRYPMGVGPAMGLPDSSDPLPAQVWNDFTFAGYADLDASPTKAEIVALRNLPSVQPYFRIAFDRRPEFELYSVTSDPHQVTNLAGRPETAAVQAELTERLMTTLRETGDPRLVDDGAFYEAGEMAAESESGRRSRARTAEQVQKAYGRELTLP